MPVHVAQQDLQELLDPLAYKEPQDRRVLWVQPEHVDLLVR